jgi:hypothetical protein
MIHLVSEQLIHDRLLSQGEQAVARTYELWRTRGKIDKRILIAFPSQGVLTDDGKIITHHVVMELDPKEDLSLALRKLTERTSAYGLLLVDPQPRAIKIYLETVFGVRCWTIPIINSGGAKLLGTATSSDNTENLGMLWMSRSLTS